MDGNSVSVSESVDQLRARVESLMLAPPSDPAAHGDALTTHQVSELLGVDRTAVTETWRAIAADHVPRALRIGWPSALATALDALEGIGTLREVASACGSAVGAGNRAYELTRVTLETSLADGIAWRRSGVTVLVSARRSAADPYEFMEHASELRHVVSGLVAHGEVVSISRLEGAVAISPELKSLGVVSGSRLADLAAAQIPYVLTNRRSDLYLSHLKPMYALAAVADTLPLREVTVDELQRRVRGRFPGALPLPSGTALDEAVLSGTGRTWGIGGYGFRDEG